MCGILCLPWQPAPSCFRLMSQAGSSRGSLEVLIELEQFLECIFWTIVTKRTVQQTPRWGYRRKSTTIEDYFSPLTFLNGLKRSCFLAKYSSGGKCKQVLNISFLRIAGESLIRLFFCLILWAVWDRPRPALIVDSVCSPSSVTKEWWKRKKRKEFFF